MEEESKNMGQGDVSLEERVAFREHVVTDQGNGGSSCSNCRYDFGGGAMVSYDKCPGCGYKLLEGGVYINRGGSDF
jgi:hypothetical protein